ncbi:DUF2332 family protein [Nocardia sp. SSK8]|uniref:DUF2332 family protein n=1 Tax=Nocardia sp. SSK8 TaxID=3120154 RepID=UPI003FA55C14
MHPAQRFREFALREARGNSPLYHRRALDIATDPETLALIAALPPDKQQPNLILTPPTAGIATGWQPSFGPVRTTGCRGCGQLARSRRRTHRSSSRAT